jgi:intein-encoded DNA endonuclease-like protein
MIIVTFTHEFKEKCMELAGLFFGSIRKIAYKVKKDTGIDISHTTIENWILGYENPQKKERIVIVDITSLTWVD